jgi:beta-glucosidase
VRASCWWWPAETHSVSMRRILKKALKWVGVALAALLVVVVVLLGWFAWNRTSSVHRARAAMEAPADTLRADGLAFRDLNRNGSLDPYEDRRLPTGVRVEDLLERMTLEEKAGQLFQTFLTPGKGGEIAGALAPMNILPVEVALFEKRMRFFNLFQTGGAEETARWTNAVQRLAERTRLGIPVTFSTDPRHGAVAPRVVASFSMPEFSPWPDPLGLAALGDSALVEEFGRIAAREYRAVGFHMALHPMADLATEPRWARISGTFGEDAALAARLTAAYVRGFQGESLGSGSVATVTKHFPGGGPQADGWDPHFRDGKDQVYPGDNFDYHLIPFRAAIDAGTALIMPYYGVPVGQTSEEVGFAFNREILSDLLRDSLGYDGIVLSDWTLLTPPKVLGVRLERFMPFAGVKDYGVEHLTPTERARKALEAGVDQFGGEASPEYVVRLVREGAVPESRLDASVRRLLTLKFELGLFDDPYVDVERVSERVGTPEARRLGEAAQRRSQVLLTNRAVGGEPALPLTRGARLYVRGLDSALAARYGTLVATPDEADVAILDLESAFEPGGGKLAPFHEGRLYYTDEELAPVLDVARRVPTVVTLYLDRPLVIPEIAGAAAAVVGHFGATDAAILDVLFGVASPEGSLPFEMPASWEAVLQQKEDVPFDSGDPLFPCGHGLRYRRPTAEASGALQ